MEPLLLFYFTLSFLLTAILYHKLRFTGVNAPPTYPVIGCLIAFYKNRHRLLSWYTDLLAASSSQTVVIRRLGARRTVITANPLNVEYMLKTNFINFPKGKPFTEILKDFLGFGIFNVDGEMWHAQRKLASHQFTSRLLKEHVVVTVKEALKSKLFVLLDSFADDDVMVDLQEVLRRFGFDVVCKFVLGFDPLCLGDRGSFPGEVPILKAFDTAGMISAKRGAIPISAVWKLKKLFGIGSEKVLKDSVKEIHEYIIELVHERKKKLMTDKCNKNRDLLSKMMNDGLSEELIRDMLISFIMAGRDTTSAAMTWLFYTLSRNADVEQRLVDEIQSKFNDEEVDGFKEMKYLQACIYEAMRLYPPVSWDSKHALHDDVLPDRTLVKAGDRVTYFPYGMGRMESIWGADRLEFKPDRWFEHEHTPSVCGDILKDVSSYKYPVFHAGPRICLGKGMANAQMSYVVSSIMKRYEIKAVGSEEALYLPSLTAHMNGGFNVLIRRRLRPGDATCQDKI